MSELFNRDAEIQVIRVPIAPLRVMGTIRRPVERARDWVVEELTLPFLEIVWFTEYKAISGSYAGPTAPPDVRHPVTGTFEQNLDIVSLSVDTLDEREHVTKVMRVGRLGWQERHRQGMFKSVQSRERDVAEYIDDNLPRLLKYIEQPLSAPDQIVAPR